MFVFIIILIIFGGLFGIYILMMRPQKSEQAQYFSRFFLCAPRSARRRRCRKLPDRLSESH